MRARGFSTRVLLILLLVVTGCTPLGKASPAAPAPAFTATANATPAATSTVIVAAATASPTPAPSPTITPAPAPAVLIGAGDIALCGDAPQYQGDDRTAAIIQSLIKEAPDAAVMVIGDAAYGDGTRAEFKNCFGPTWGQFKDRIHPALGNHEYMTDNAAPYFEYFGAAAGPVGLGYYSYDLGDWHIVVLNANCDQIACTPESQQVQWLRADLQNSGKQCTLAYWHQPRWSSGLTGGGFAATLWKTAVEMGVDVVVNGHDHDYERLAPMDASGAADPRGAREFVVGTGGGELRDWGKINPNSEVRYNGVHGVIKFTLFPGTYQWDFIPAEDASMTDAGAGDCH